MWLLQAMLLLQLITPSLISNFYLNTCLLKCSRGILPRVYGACMKHILLFIFTVLLSLPSYGSVVIMGTRVIYPAEQKVLMSG